MLGNVKNITLRTESAPCRHICLLTRVESSINSYFSCKSSGLVSLDEPLDEGHMSTNCLPSSNVYETILRTLPVKATPVYHYIGVLGLTREEKLQLGVQSHRSLTEQRYVVDRVISEKNYLSAQS
eukprot:CFRG7452T1